MKNIYIRSGLNRKLNENIKNIVESVDYFKIPEFKNYKFNSKNVFLDKLSLLKYFTDFKIESDEFLEKIILSIESFDSVSLINLCDSCEFVFYKTFEKVQEIPITKDNFRKMFLLFMELFRNGMSVNSLNLSLIMLNNFDRLGVSKFCENIFKINDHLEVTSFVIKNNSIKFDFLNEISWINREKNFSYKNILIRFYCLDVVDFDFEIDDFKLVIEYAYNLKKCMNYFGNAILLCENKDILQKFARFLDKIQNNFENKFTNFQKLDYRKLYFVLKLFPNLDYTKEQLKVYVLEGIKNDLNENILSHNKFKIGILNDLDLNISNEIISNFKNQFYSTSFCEIFLRYFRKYKYFWDLINQFEDEIYITDVVNNKCFRKFVLRLLTVFYSSLSYEIVGIRILKFIMNYENFYNENSDYINFIVEKVLERSV